MKTELENIASATTEINRYKMEPQTTEWPISICSDFMKLFVSYLKSLT